MCIIIANLKQINLISVQVMVYAILQRDKMVTSKTTATKVGHSRLKGYVKLIFIVETYYEPCFSNNYVEYFVKMSRNSVRF